VRLCAALLMFLCLVATARAGGVCARDTAAAAALARLEEAMAHGRFVTYEPTTLMVRAGQVHEADAAGIRADLTVLRGHFDGLITYDAVHGAQQVAPIAAQLKFRALVIGVWNPFVPAEVDAALQAAQRYPQLVVGISLGNEMLFSHRADVPRLSAAVAAVRARLPALPLSVTEPFHLFEAPPGAALLPQLDFMLVNIHPVFQPWFAGSTEATAAQFVVNVTGDLAARYCGPIIVKETGLPTGPAAAGFSAVRQARFYHELQGRFAPSAQRAFAWFSAFDAPWRAQDDTGVPGGPHPEEAFWGLYDAQRRPKLAIDRLAGLEQDRPAR